MLFTWRSPTVFLLALMFFPCGLAHGEEPAEPLVKATAIAMPHPGVSEDTMAGIMRAVEGGMKKNPRLAMLDLDARLADFAQEIPQGQIEAARQAFKSGTQALAESKISRAVQKLEDAVNELAKVLPYIKKQELADAMNTLAVARIEGGDRAAGKREFVRLLTWRQDHVYDAARFPPQYFTLFTEAQHDVEKAKLGSLRIASEPDGAQAYVDGKYYGITPCTAEQLPVGTHFVTVKKDGYRKAVAPAEVSTKKERRVDFSLARSEKYLLVGQTITNVNKTLGIEVADPSMDNLREILFIDHAVFVRAASSGASDITVNTYLYDLRTRRLLAHVERVISRAKIEAELPSIIPSLYANVSYEGELALPQETALPQQQARKPLVKSWWFWTSLVVVAGGIAGAAAAIALTQPASCPSGSFCPVIRY